MSVISLRPAVETPLCNLDAEHGLLGSLLYDNRILADFADVHPEMFYEPVHGELWNEIVSIVGKGRIAEPLAVAERLAQSQSLQELGGAGYLAEMVDRAYTPAARSHADLVVNAYRLRTLIEVTDSLRGRARAGEDAFDLIAGAERLFSDMVQEAAPAAVNLIDARSSAMVTLDELDTEAQHGRTKGFMTGLRCFDRRLRGLRPGWLVVVAGRPSMGKTALARAAAFGCARKTGARVIFFALEMARRELDERTLSQLSYQDGEGVAYTDMSGEKLGPLERARLRRLGQTIPTNFIIDDSPILSVDYVRRRVLSMKQRGPVAAVFIDYLQIMERPDAKGRNEASVIGEMTKGLKQLAREAETCVVLLSQINRGVEQRDDKRPQLSDLRESGAIEQDANAVLFPYRQVYYDERAKPADQNKIMAWQDKVETGRRSMDVIAAKVRQGAVGTDAQIYFAEYDHIEDAPEDRR